jgi:tripartite-type tricarboxylate transporter receptor subunit TctC
MAAIRTQSAAVALAAALACGIAATAAHAEDAFYAGKRLTVLVNFAPGGSTDAEARVFARHIGRLIDGQPGVIIQNMDGAGGLVGGKYVGEVAPRDGSLMGYFTATGFLYALDPERFKVDFKSYEFVGIQPGTSINFVRTDVAPGMKEPRDIVKATNLIIGSLAPDSSKGVRMRLAFDVLGVPYKYISGYRSGGAAKLAFERGEINFWGESPPSYGSIIEPGLVKSGAAIPIYQDPGYDGQKFFLPDSAKAIKVPQFQTLYREIKGADPSGQLWEVYKSVLAADGTMQRLIVMPPGVPAAAVDALRAGLARLNKDKAHAEDAEKAFGYVPVWQIGTDNNAMAQRAMTIRPEVRAFLLDYIKNPPK